MFLPPGSGSFLLSVADAKRSASLDHDQLPFYPFQTSPLDQALVIMNCEAISRPMEEVQEQFLAKQQRIIINSSSSLFRLPAYKVSRDCIHRSPNFCEMGCNAQLFEKKLRKAMTFIQDIRSRLAKADRDKPRSSKTEAGEAEEPNDASSSSSLMLTGTEYLDVPTVKLIQGEPYYDEPFSLV
jgi:hypothetical protein